jgi:hypothetical protein
VVACGRRDHRLAVETGEDVERSPDLERPGPLHAFGLEIDVTAGDTAERLRPDEWGL